MLPLFTESFHLSQLEHALEQATVNINEGIDDLLGPVVDNTPLGQLVSTGDEEQSPFADDPDNVGIFAPGQFVFDLLA